MAASSQRHYYEAYWLERARWDMQPPLGLRELFERYVSAADLCLDVGCGDGGTSGPWLRTNAASYVGVDVSERAVRAAAARGLTVRLVEDAAQLPFLDDSFDLVVCVEVLEHLFEPQRALAEMQRVVRRGGRLILTVPNVAHWRGRIDLALLGRWNPRGDSLSGSEPWRDPHIRFFSLSSLASLVERSGFEVLELGGYVERGFLQSLPGLRSCARTTHARPWVRWLAGRFPRLLGGTLYAVGRAPTGRDR
jgi:methionine biosynthesis protein MetW